MKKQKKFLIQIIIFLSLLLSSCQVFATSITDYIGELQFSEDYLNYLELSDEERENVIVPRMYEIPKTTKIVTNPLGLARMLGSTLENKYSLKTIIPENMVIKNQQQTNSCWAFSSLAALESNLALKDYKNNKTSIVYDFSERHMEYATSQSFLDGTNKNGFAREVGEGGNSYLYVPYLTNGTGAIAEAKMPFENNEDSIYIREIQDKDVITQVNDIVTFPSYSSTDDKTEIIKQMKEHIKNYGAIDVGIHGASLKDSSRVYNNETGAIYCNNKFLYPVDHAVAVIGWDDNYSIENFVEGNKPTKPGAWIIKNSWGTNEQYTLEEMKEIIFEEFPDECANKGWTDATQISDDIAILNFTEWGYTIDENNIATYKVGDNGFMYVSYEDVNIYTQMTGIMDAQTEIEYENIYQYDQYGGYATYNVSGSKIYLATVFNKQTTGKEYLTQVSIYAPETYTCKVYVNPKGTSKSKNDLQQVKLKAGETETFDAGYHTIEFIEPLKIEGDKFVVVLEVQGSQTYYTSVLMEFNYGDFFGADADESGKLYDNVVIENGKCFLTTLEGFANNQWDDSSNIYTLTEGRWPDFDTTIKAFTTSKVLESITVTTPPTKTSYIVGQDFDPTGMIVKANYANGNSIEITDYIISNGTNLGLGQTSVTISYKGKTVTQVITVEENTVESLKITTAPTKTEYWAGEDFDSTGMVIEAIYKDGTTKSITNGYIVKDGKNIRNAQTSVTIEYEGKAVTLEIKVNANPVVKVEITKVPNKIEYVVGQNFNSEGMVVKVTYENGMVKEVTDYTIANGTNLQKEQLLVTIEYEGKTVTQEITVVEKAVISISVKTMPTKTEYIQNKETLDLTGGIIKITYNDETTEEMSMTSKEIQVTGFSNSKAGIITLTLTYQGKTTQFNVEIKEIEKPKHSKFDNVSGNVTGIKVHVATDSNDGNYSIITVELSNISKETGNDNIEYYYYLSANSNEENIANWVKIGDLNTKDGKMTFDINTLELTNAEEIGNAEKLYVYIKEVATKNNIKSELVTSAVVLNIDMDKLTAEGYIDEDKKVEVEAGEIQKPGSSESLNKVDDTTVQSTIPKAGKSLMVIFIVIIMFVICRFAYLRYKDIQIK